MNASIDLVRDEKILFEAESVILTNQRLLAKKTDSEGGSPWDESALGNVTSCKKVTGGQESHLKDGLTFGAVGAALTGLDFVLTDTNRIMETLIFVAGAAGILAGAYLLTKTAFRLRPHTTVWFDVFDEEEVRKRDVPVTFPGKDNPKADNLTRVFDRAKRRR